jgi:CheY-like chemotaxis protein
MSTAHLHRTLPSSEPNELTGLAPPWDTAPPSPASGDASRVDATQVPKRILVVDDNVDGADALAMLLELGGHTVCVAYDGPQALKACAELHPDVVFLDIGLPCMDGYEVARRLREREAQGDLGAARPFLIALTGWGTDADRRRALDAGFDHHLTKPVQPETLDAFLARLASDRPIGSGQG